MTFFSEDQLVDFELEVRKGIDALDAKYPKWREIVDFSKVSMKDYGTDIIGQLWRKPGYDRGLLSFLWETYPCFCNYKEYETEFQAAWHYAIPEIPESV